MLQIRLFAPTFMEMLVNGERWRYRRKQSGSETVLSTKAYFSLVGTFVRKAEVLHFRSGNGLYFNIALRGLSSDSHIAPNRDVPFDDASIKEHGIVRIMGKMAGDFLLAVHNVEAWHGETVPAEQGILERQLVIAVLQSQSRRRGNQAAIAE